MKNREELREFLKQIVGLPGSAVVIACHFADVPVLLVTQPLYDWLLGQPLDPREAGNDLPVLAMMDTLTGRCRAACQLGMSRETFAGLVKSVLALYGDELLAEISPGTNVGEITMYVLDQGFKKAWSEKVECSCGAKLQIERGDLCTVTSVDPRGEKHDKTVCMCPICGTDIPAPAKVGPDSAFPAQDAWFRQEFVKLHAKIRQLTPPLGGYLDR